VEVVRSRFVDRRVVAAFLAGQNARHVARRGELVDSLDHPALLANLEGELVGVATYVVGEGECELLTLHARRPFLGIGTALLSALEDLAQQADCTRLWVVTTNDNVDALRFYQRRGFRLAALRPEAVTRSRQALKPAIPTTGLYGIDLRDEIELEMHLT
jgi:ribosomal protein S18 acetylase RimI-like enzyme